MRLGAALLFALALEMAVVLCGWAAVERDWPRAALMGCVAGAILTWFWENRR